MNELQLLALAEKALHDNGIRGHLFKRTSENSKWQMRYFVLFQNILFYFENESTSKPSGLIFLEGSYCDKMVTPSTGKSNNTGSANLQVCCCCCFWRRRRWSQCAIVLFHSPPPPQCYHHHHQQQNNIVCYLPTNALLAFLQYIYRPFL